MTVKFEELPPELWVELERWLSVSDLLQLRVTNKKMLQNMSQQQMWKRICYRDWYKYILDEEEIYCKVTNKRKTYEMTYDWCEQGRVHWHSDHHILHKIEELTEYPLGKTFWIKFDQILKNNNDALLPILYKITTQERERNSDMKYGLELKTCAQHVLDHILHGSYYQAVRQATDHLFREANSHVAWRATEDVLPETEYLEPLLLHAAKFDSAYPMISGKVLEVRERVRNRIDKKIHSHWDIFWNDTTKNKVRIIISTTLKTLRIGKCKEYLPEGHFYAEDCFITRIYAGETIGHRFLLLVILQSICRQYKIVSRLSHDYLIFEDSTDPYGEFYFTLAGRRVYRTLIYRPELRTIVSRDASRLGQDVDTLLAQYLKPFDGFECLHFIIYELCDSSCSSICDHYENLDDPSIIIKDYTPLYSLELMNVPWNSFDRKMQIQNLYPYSKRRMLAENLIDMSRIYHEIRHIRESPGEEHWDEYNYNGNNWFKELKKTIIGYYPWDYTHVVGCNPLDTYRDYMAPCSEGFGILTYEEGHKKAISVGKFMRWRKKELVLILCQVRVHMVYHSLTSTDILTCKGVEYHIPIKELDNGTTYPITVEEINTFIEVVTPLNKLGMIFQSFDSNTGIGVLNIKAKDTIERELKESDIAIMKINKNKKPKLDM